MRKSPRIKGQAGGRGVTSIVGLSVVALSVIHLASLARVAVEESKARATCWPSAIFHPRPRSAGRWGGGSLPGASRRRGLRSIPPNRASIPRAWPPRRDRGCLRRGRGPRRSVAAGPALWRAANRLDPLLRARRLRALFSIYSRGRAATVEVSQPLLLERQAFSSIRVGVSTLLIRRELDAALGPALLTRWRSRW